MNDGDMILPDGVRMEVLRGPSLLVVEERSATNIVLMLSSKVEFSEVPVPLEIKVMRGGGNAIG